MRKQSVRIWCVVIVAFFICSFALAGSLLSFPVGGKGSTLRYSALETAAPIVSACVQVALLGAATELDSPDLGRPIEIYADQIRTAALRGPEVLVETRLSLMARGRWTHFFYKVKTSMGRGGCGVMSLDLIGKTTDN